MFTNAKNIEELKKEKEFLICIDSDGCAFDTMEIKHKECFTPNTIREWGLQPISRFARDASEYVNLYSKFRGINRFPGLIMVFDLLAQRKEVIERKFQLPDITALRRWVETEINLGNPTLEKHIEKNSDSSLVKALSWSKAVNESITKMVFGVPPFPFVKESLEKVLQYVDIIVVSATPAEALEREWAEHDLVKYVKFIAGQETGSKKTCINLAKNLGYEDDKVLMIGDALGDFAAAKDNKALFYPILPSNEDKSWERFKLEAFDRFINGSYKGDYENSLVGEFEACLPSMPPWN